MTVTPAKPLTEPRVALTCTKLAAFTQVATPWLPAVLLRLATEVSDEPQVAIFVTSCVLPSARTAAALN